MADTGRARGLEASPTKKTPPRTADLSTLTMQGSKNCLGPNLFLRALITIVHNVAPQQLTLVIFLANINPGFARAGDARCASMPIPEWSCLSVETRREETKLSPMILPSTFITNGLTTVDQD